VRSLILSILASTSVCVGQQSTSDKQAASPLVDKRKPSAYLSFSRYDAERKEVWLNVVNNTRWYISSIGLPVGLDSGWCYWVVTDDGCRTPIYPPPVGNCGDVIGVTGAQAGRGTLLAVAAEGLSRGLAIEIHFSYEWERAGGVMHTVRFGHSELPETVKSKLPFDWSIARPLSACNDITERQLPPAVRLLVPPIPQSTPELILQAVAPKSPPEILPAPPIPQSTQPKKK